MKAVIHQAFCHIFDFNACASPLTQVHNAFVRDEAVFALEKNGKARIETFSDVISIENRQLACAFQTVGAHHPNVHPRNGQNARAAPRSGCYVATVASAVSVIRIAGAARQTLSVLCFAKQNSASLVIDDVFAWEIRHEMSRNADRSHTRTAAAVWDTKC